MTECSDHERTELKVGPAVLHAAVGAMFPHARVTVLRRSPERYREKSSEEHVRFPQDEGGRDHTLLPKQPAPFE